MARVHGKDCRVYLGGRDASGDLASVTPKFTAQTHDVTNFASGDWVEHDPGLLGWECAVDGFYDPAAAGYGRQLENFGSAISATTIVDGDANAIGDNAILLPSGVLETYDQPNTVADMRKLAGNIKGSSKAGLFGKLLHVKGEETGTGSGASLNNSASSANGGRGNAHITAITGTWTLKVQHSTNDSAWADLVTFTQAAAAGGVTSESKEVAGTVNQYLRADWTEDVAGSATFVVAFARY